MIKSALCVVIVALAASTTGALEQGKAKAKDKGKTSAPAPAAQPPAGTSCAPDTTPPVIAAVSASPATLGAPNHKMTPVSITAKVTDNCGTPTWTVTGITSNEPVNGTGDGDTEPDWAVRAPHAVSLRAERAGTGSGRIYTITIVAKDTAGNTSTGSTTVAVPHNR
jgi:hypothetical protein